MARKKPVVEEPVIEEPEAEQAAPPACCVPGKVIRAGEANPRCENCGKVMYGGAAPSEVASETALGNDADAAA